MGTRRDVKVDLPLSEDEDAPRVHLSVSMAGDAIVRTTARVHPEPRPLLGAVARPWDSCTIPGCRHDPCPAKLRAWAGYGRRYICGQPGCPHRDCPARRRSDEDGQPFGLPYRGPALPQHVVRMDGTPLGSPMRAESAADGSWRLWPLRDRSAGFDA
jgi:hypothetical protein